MLKNDSEIKLACEEILLDFAKKQRDWKYVKSKRTFTTSVSRNSSLNVFTGLSSKVDFVKFEFGLGVVHKLVKKANPYSSINLLLFLHRQRWDPAPINNGRCTVYDPQKPGLELFEEARSQGRKTYVHLEEFPERLAAVFKRAEAEIDRLFDLSSEEALIQSIVEKPIGFFRPNEVLLIQLLLGNPGYYDELVKFYDQPLETLRSLEIKNPFNGQAAEKLMADYAKGDFPKFDFVT